MEDQSLFNSSQPKTISEGLQNFIDSMVEEIVIEGKPFDTQKKYLKKFSENEGLDYEVLEKNLMDLFETFEELKSSESKACVRLAKMLAKDCYLDESMVDRLVSTMNEAKEKKESKAKEEAERKANEEKERQEKQRKAEALFQQWVNFYPKGTVVDNEKAEKRIHLLKESAELGYSIAQNRLSKAYSYGMGVKKDLKEAFKWAMASALQGSPWAQAEVGADYLYGFGVEPSDELAFSWLSKSVENGHSTGMIYLAICYLYGIGTARNKTYAEKLIAQAEETIKKTSDDPKRISMPSRMVETVTPESIERARKDYYESQKK